jgi:hypothetical protein
MQVGFQTLKKNAPLMDDIELARRIVTTAQGVLNDAVRRAFPVGARVSAPVGGGRTSYFTVRKHTEHPSKWMLVVNDRTDKEKMMDMTGYGIELVTYAYEVHQVQEALDACGSVTYSMELAEQMGEIDDKSRFRPI